ncbi:MAG TPA: HlyD family type I secretion periplasmic adaptor subunit [Porticoccaceae bacterium]|nr:HlyD family type I secretion periplasmic adaptor subunit [Porticoccaceae bacterium]
MTEQISPREQTARGITERLRSRLDVTPATDLKYMSYSSEAMLQKVPAIQRLLLWTIMLCVVVALVWAYFAEVDEFTRGQGRIVPSGDVQVVQNLEGGILTELLVAEGDIVQKDQPLLLIDDTIFSSTLRERSLQIEQLQAQVSRLRAEADGTDFDEEWGRLGKELTDPIAENERQLYLSRQSEFRSRVTALNQKVEQKKQELSSARLHKRSLASSYELLKRELDITRPLVEAGAVSHVELLRLERQVNDLKGGLGRADFSIPQLQAEYQEAKTNSETYAQNYANEARREMNEANAELERLLEGNDTYSDRVDRTTVRSPVRGTIKQIKVKTRGGVIKPGMDLVEIVPIDDSLLVDARVLPSDIAFIHPDQKAMVKFTAYDFAIHGGLSARVTQISPDTIVDDEGVSYYQIRLKTDNSELGRGEEALPIITGMTVEVDILTGKKTILDYLLKPILKTKQLAFRER